ncbi:MAG: TRAP transporter fused permease subunit [Deltaproteobacteria bacterium]|nr:TRAP transporter fused permease subunit [Deltaproteobacteria bacterium]
MPLFVLFEVNYPRLSPQSQLAIFATLGLVLLFLQPRDRGDAAGEGTVWGLAALAGAAVTLAVGVYLVVQTEPAFESWWIDGRSLGERAGVEVGLDIVVGVIGLVLILIATWRSIGAALPILAGLFLAYGYWGNLLPDWLLPHRGYDVSRLVGQTFLHSQGVFGVALRVMFTYVFLFVLFGALLEVTGATEFIIETSRRRFRRSPGGAAKVAVITSGMMGSLSGSAVANTVSTGTFTIPLMKSAGFLPRVAAGLEAAASSGGALVPPVMGAGAYMMLEIIDPPVSYLQIIRAALIPAVLYYLSLYLIVHFYGQKVHAGQAGEPADELATLIVLLLSGFTVFRSVSVAMVAVVLLSMVHRRTRLAPTAIVAALRRAASSGVSLVAAASCVGVIIGVVTLTGVGTRLPSLILPLAQDHLLLALILIMVSSIVLGMGLPSAVCYLLMATLIGPVLGNLGVVPLAAHLFIFYFGMMSMVTPPVALAGYAASSIAGSKLIETSTSAFRFALVGFTLPYMFVFRPELLMLTSDGRTAAVSDILLSTGLAAAGILALAAAIAGFVKRPLSAPARLAFLLVAGLLLNPGGRAVFWTVSLSHLAGLALLGVLWWVQQRTADSA